MKKILICLGIMLLASGCDGTDNLQCKNTTTTNGLTTDITYDIDYEEDDVKYVTITYKYTQDTQTNNDTTTDNNNMGTTDTNTTNNYTSPTTDENNNTTGTTNNTTRNTTNNNLDGTDADTDGTTEDNDSQKNDQIIDGIVGDAIDESINTITTTILDIAGIRTNYNNQIATFDDLEGFSYDVKKDTDEEYIIVYKIDLEKMSDNDLARFNVDRSFTDIQNTYQDLGYTCK